MTIYWYTPLIHGYTHRPTNKSVSIYFCHRMRHRRRFDINSRVHDPIQANGNVSISTMTTRPMLFNKMSRCTLIKLLESVMCVCLESLYIAAGMVYFSNSNRNRCHFVNVNFFRRWRRRRCWRLENVYASHHNETVGDDAYRRKIYIRNVCAFIFFENEEWGNKYMCDSCAAHLRGAGRLTTVWNIHASHCRLIFFLYVSIGNLYWYRLIVSDTQHRISGIIAARVNILYIAQCRLLFSI